MEMTFILNFATTPPTISLYIWKEWEQATSTTLFLALTFSACLRITVYDIYTHIFMEIISKNQQLVKTLWSLSEAS